MLMAHQLPTFASLLRPPQPERERELEPSQSSLPSIYRTVSTSSPSLDSTNTPRLQFPSFKTERRYSLPTSGSIRPNGVSPVLSSVDDHRSVRGMSTAATPPTIHVRERTSRYLSEGDRRDIIARIAAGEKQVALAKEYSVSRAAICNLYKNRREVLTRSSRDPDAKHPKRQRINSGSSPTGGSELHPTMQPRPSSPSPVSSSSPTVMISASSSHMSTSHKSPTTRSPRLPTSYELPPMSRRLEKWSANLRVHEVSASSRAVRNLVGSLRDATCVGPAFQHRAARLMRLLIEEVLATLPNQDVEVQTSHGDVCRVAHVVEERDICGVALEHSGMALLRAFSDIQPGAPTGMISVGSQAGDEVRAQLPALHSRQVVLVMDVECATGRSARAAVDHLVHACGVAPANIYFVSVVSSQPGIEAVCQQFPDVAVVTAQVDATLDEQQQVRPGIPDFKRRFWNLPSAASSAV